MTTWRLNRRGDTLVEVVLAIAILASVLATAYHMSTAAFQLGVESRERTQAVNLVQQQAEALRWYADSQMAAGTSLLSSQLGGCTSGCYMTPVSASGTSVVAGSEPTGICGAVIPTCTLGFKTVTAAITSDPNSVPANSQPYPEVDELITITWVSSSTGLTDSSSLNLRLADTTKFTPHDCSIAGSAGCSVDTSASGMGTGGAAGPTGGVGGSWSWFITGSGYANPVGLCGGLTPVFNGSACVAAGDGNSPGCAPREPAQDDGLDGCFRLGTSMYARRDIYTNYNISDGVTTGTIPAGIVHLTISYNQYGGAGTLPPSGYPGYALTIKVAAGHGITTTAASLPIGTDSSAYNAISSGPIAVAIPAGGSPTIEIDWTNNAWVGGGGNPDIQINSLQLGP